MASNLKFFVPDGTKHPLLLMKYNHILSPLHDHGDFNKHFQLVSSYIHMHLIILKVSNYRFGANRSLQCHCDGAVTMLLHTQLLMVKCHVQCCPSFAKPGPL